MRGSNLNDIRCLVKISMVVLSTEDKIRKWTYMYHSSFYGIVTENSEILYLYVFKKVPIVLPK